MEATRRLIDYYLPPAEGFVLESLIATTYQVDFEFLEEELLASALGVRSPVSRLKAFRSELERGLQKAEVSVLYDLAGCERLTRLSPRIDPITISGRKLHSKISLLMWIRENTAAGVPPDRRIRLIVGSANLTRQGFRSNYECVASVDYGGRSTSPRKLLASAIESVQQISAGATAPQLARQLAAFTAQSKVLPEGSASPDDPVAFVAAHDVVPTIRDTWLGFSNEQPQKVTVVSPFWAEGPTAGESLHHFLKELGATTMLELVCRGERSPCGKDWLPVFDGTIAVDLRNRLGGRVVLRAALPDEGVQASFQAAEEIGDELEEKELAARLGAQHRNAAEVQRPLHAKMILLDGTSGSVLYVGSSNCTRRGLGLGGPSNFEAGFVYRLTHRQRRQVAGLLEFAGPPSEAGSDGPPATVQPPCHDEVIVPAFLGEVTASGTGVTIRFRQPPPSDLVLLMPIPTKAGDAGYWLLYRTDAQVQPPPENVQVDIAICQRCDERLDPLAGETTDQNVVPHVFVEVRWEGRVATFPVRFDDKASLPLLLVGRKPTEGELVDYFLFGREPDESDNGSGPPGDASTQPSADSPIDTRRILAYFIRRFVQAIPGIENEVRRASYSRASLDAALRGPTSPLELAERAFSSLTQAPRSDEPRKTATAVGFQLAEIIAALIRCQKGVVCEELRGCFDPVINRCREMLDALVSRHLELQTHGFRLYRERILGGAP